MAKYRKKPVIIEAEQWFPDKEISGVIFLPAQEVSSRTGGIAFTMPKRAVIDTLEGVLFVSPGDWIITGIQGEKYPCKPDIFQATYEPAEG
jgi:hypothetical protein